jgi:hypothetical protein
MKRLRGSVSLRAIVAFAAVTLVLAGLATAGAAPQDSQRGRTPSGPKTLTLVFAGQVVSDAGLEAFVDPYPPIEGGAAQQYTVPADRRLVIEAMYADVYERYVSATSGQPATYPRSGIGVGISTVYPNPDCEFPGYERGYGIPLIAPIVGTSENETELVRHGSLSGPIFVEGSRVVGGTAFAPNGDSTVYVKIVVHGHLEDADNPDPPVFDCGE